MDARATHLAEEIIEISDDSSGDAVTDPETAAIRMDAEFVALQVSDRRSEVACSSDVSAEVWRQDHARARRR